MQRGTGLNGQPSLNGSRSAARGISPLYPDAEAVADAVSGAQAVYQATTVSHVPAIQATSTLLVDSVADRSGERGSAAVEDRSSLFNAASPRQ